MIEGFKLDHSWHALWILNYAFDASYFDVFPVLCITSRQNLIDNMGASISNFQATDTFVTYARITWSTTRLEVLGAPIRWTHVSILDPDSTYPTTSGSIGGLCIHGTHVGRSYLNQPKTTTTAFIADASGQKYTARATLSASPAIMKSNSSAKNKISGYNIELGESRIPF
jgi:non-ribosomal peptide synthetase component F